MKNQKSSIQLGICLWVICLLPLAAPAQPYEVFQKMVESPVYSHINTAGQGYVLSSVEGGIARTDENLDILWRRNLGFPQLVIPVAGRLRGGSDNLLLAGHFNSPQQADYTPVMVETDPQGAPLWMKRYIPSGATGPMGAVARLARPGADGGFLIAGEILNGSAGDAEWYLLKLDAAGIIGWSAGYRSNGQEAIADIRQLPNGDYIILFTVDDELALLRLNAAGQAQWGRRYAVGQQAMLFAAVVHDSLSGGFVVACSPANSNKSLLFRTNAIGDIVWSREYETLGGSVNRFQAIEAVSGGFIIGGSYISTTQARNAFTLKTDANGQLQWNSLYLAAGENQLVAMQSAPGRGVVFSGVMPGIHNQGLLTRINPGGYSGQCPGGTIFFFENPGNVANGAPAHPSPLLPVAVSFQNPSLDALVSQVFPPPMQTVYCSDVVAVREAAVQGLSARIFPNPATTHATVAFDEPLYGAEGVAQLYDLSGRALYSGVVAPGARSVEIDLGPYPVGTYLVKVVSGGRVFGGKVVKGY
jgi:hypothetical protein